MNEQDEPLQLRLNGLVSESIVDGPGLRLALFTQGCPHNCKGCHNPETHDSSGGYIETVDKILATFNENKLLSGITFSGGEPFMQPKPLIYIAKKVHEAGKNVLTYTGFKYEKLLELGKSKREIKELLDLIDILVDGPYIEELRDLELQFKGSSNQRILNLNDIRQGLLGDLSK